MVSRPRPARPVRLRAAAILALAAALVSVAPASAESNSARYRFEGNRWLSLDLAVGEIRTDMIRFEWPSTLLGFKTGYKALVKVVNGSTRQVSIGLAVALYDGDMQLLGAGTTGTKLGTLSPGDSAEFAVDFNSVTERLGGASQFQIALEAR